MPYQLPQQLTNPRDSQWLGMLVATFETVTHDGEKPSAAAVAGLKARLSRPAGYSAARSNGLH